MEDETMVHDGELDEVLGMSDEMSPTDEDEEETEDED
jgi:hypothetical protein